MTNRGISKKQQKYVSEADCSGQFHGSHLIGLECVCVQANLKGTSQLCSSRQKRCLTVNMNKHKRKHLNTTLKNDLICPLRSWLSPYQKTLKRRKKQNNLKLKPEKRNKGRKKTIQLP